MVQKVKLDKNTEEEHEVNVTEGEYLIYRALKEIAAELRRGNK